MASRCAMPNAQMAAGLHQGHSLPYSRQRAARLVPGMPACEIEEKSGPGVRHDASALELDLHGRLLLGRRRSSPPGRPAPGRRCRSRETSLFPRADRRDEPLVLRGGLAAAHVLPLAPCGSACPLRHPVLVVRAVEVDLHGALVAVDAHAQAVDVARGPARGVDGADAACRRASPWRRSCRWRPARTARCGCPCTPLSKVSRRQEISAMSPQSSAVRS